MHVGVLRRQRGLEDTAEGLMKVARGDGVAVGPLGGLTEEEGVSELVGGDFPALGGGVNLVCRKCHLTLWFAQRPKAL